MVWCRFGGDVVKTVPPIIYTQPMLKVVTSNEVYRIVISGIQLNVPLMLTVKMLKCCTSKDYSQKIIIKPPVPSHLTLSTDASPDANDAKSTLT